MSQVDERSNRQHEAETSDGVIVRSSQPEDEAGSFVERETRRRKRQLRLYLMLLVIPVAVGIVVLVFGRSDSRMVTDEIKAQAPPIVQREVGQQIKPTIESEVQKQISLPLEQIDNKINEVEKSKASLEEVTKTVQEGNEFIRSELNNRLTLSGVSREEINKLREENKALRIELNNLKTSLEGKFQALQQRVITLSNQDRIPRQLPPG